MVLPTNYVLRSGATQNDPQTEFLTLPLPSPLPSILDLWPRGVTRTLVGRPAEAQDVENGSRGRSGSLRTSRHNLSAIPWEGRGLFF